MPTLFQRKAQEMGAMAGGLTYAQKIKNMFGASLIAYFPLSETNGTAALDISGNNLNGSYSGAVAKASEINPYTGKQVPYWNGTNDGYVSIAASLARFNFNEGAIVCLIKPDSDVPSGSTARQLFQIQSSTATSYVKFLKANTGAYAYAEGRQVTSTYDPYGGFTTFSPAEWHSVVCSWSRSTGFTDVFVDGNMFIHTAITLTSIVSATAGLIGSLGGMNTWKGNISDFATVDRRVAQAEARTHFSNMNKPYAIKLSILGDSISTGADYAELVQASYPIQKVRLLSHAIAGQNVVGNMDAQTADASGDGANIIIIALGTNDDNSIGNKGNIQAKVESNIDALKLSNPGAAIYYLGPMSRWTNVGGGTVYDLTNVRSAISTACGNKSITYWDTFTTPWIAASDTADGTHPTQAGHAKVATQVLARI